MGVVCTYPTLGDIVLTDFEPLKGVTAGVAIKCK